MSEFFSHKVKAEAAGNISGRKKCDACLAGMLLFCRELSQESVVFRTENEVVRDLFIRLADHAAGQGAACVSRLERSPKPALWLVKVKGKKNVDALFERAGIAFREGPRSLEMVNNLSDKNFGSFAAGVFLTCASVINPEKGYHLEFVISEEKLCTDLRDAFSDRLGVQGKVTGRGSKFVLYFKESEQIEDMLTLIGASGASLEIMNIKIYKDVRNKANRATNCDTANLGRQNRSAVRQIEAIEKIKASEGGLSSLPDELRELCELRLENPELSLSELMNLTNPPLSRSGVNHRFARILEIADSLEEM